MREPRAISCEIIALTPRARPRAEPAANPLRHPQPTGRPRPLPIVALTAGIFGMLVAACLVWFSVVVMLAVAIVFVEMARRCLQRLAVLGQPGFERRRISYESP